MNDLLLAQCANSYDYNPSIMSVCSCERHGSVVMATHRMTYPAHLVELLLVIVLLGEASETTYNISIGQSRSLRVVVQFLPRVSKPYYGYDSCLKSS